MTGMRMFIKTKHDGYGMARRLVGPTLHCLAYMPRQCHAGPSRIYPDIAQTDCGQNITTYIHNKQIYK